MLPIVDVPHRTLENDVGLPLDFVACIEFPSVKIDQGNPQEAAHRLFLVDEEARQVLRKVLVFVGIKGFDAVERGKDLLPKPISLFAHDGRPCVIVAKRRPPSTWTGNARC
jgi:hypothetical protein